MLRTLHVVVAIAVLAGSALAGGETLDVNSTLDLPDADLGDGVCDADLEAAELQITLRAAIMHANSTPEPDTINLPEGLYKLTLQGHDEDASATGDLDITESVSINGAGTLTTIVDGKKAKDRVFDVFEGISVTFEAFTIRRGAAPTKDIDDQRGGGIRNEGDLTLDHMEVTKCKTGDADGGGISHEDGTLTLLDSIISKNKSGDDGGGVDVSDGTIQFTRSSFVKNKAKSDGGGVECSPANGSMENCTFSANSAADTGGALSANDGADLTLTNCTLAKNKAKQGGSGIAEDVAGGDTIELANCIVSNKKTTNYAGDGLTSLGHNVDSGTTCGFGTTGDLEDTDPRLLKLKASATGELPVHQLKPDSPCIDAADDLLCPATDQLGQDHVDIADVGATVCDIGAVEFVLEGEG